jgi:hypothetical protein
MFFRYIHRIRSLLYVSSVAGLIEKRDPLDTLLGCQPRHQQPHYGPSCSGLISATSPPLVLNIGETRTLQMPYSRLCKVLAVELIYDFSRGLHNLHSPRRIRVAAQRNLIVADGKLQLLARNRGNSCVFYLALNMLSRLIWMPCPMYGKHRPKQEYMDVTYFFFRSMTNVPSLLYLTSP